MRAYSTASRELISGAPPREFSLPAVSNPTFFSGDWSFRVQVPEGAESLLVRLDTALQNTLTNVNLYVNHGADPVVADGQIISDYSSTGLFGKEFIFVHSESSPPL